MSFPGERTTAMSEGSPQADPHHDVTALKERSIREVAVENQASKSIHHESGDSAEPSLSIVESGQSKTQPSTTTGGFTKSTSHCTAGPGSVLCSVCPKCASKSCLTCIASYCEIHVNHHYTTPALQTHKMVEATGDLEQRLCQQHYRVLELFCKTDQTPVCVLCVAKQHGGHEITELEEKQSLQMKESEMAPNKTSVPVPERLTVNSLTAACGNSWSAELSWSLPHGMDQSNSFQISYHSEGTVPENTTTNECHTVITDLQPDTMYTVSVCLICPEGQESPNASVSFHTSEIRLVLLGKTGIGKSSTGNTILGEKTFDVMTCSESVTDECKAAIKITSGRGLKVIDTPGFFDTNNLEKQFISEIAKCITECSPGPHAFIIVMRVDKCTKQEQEVLKKIKEIFGDEALKYAVILFTCGDQLDEGQTIEAFVNQSRGRQESGNSEIRKNALKELVDACSGQYHVIDNKYWNQEHAYRSNRVQVKKLLDSIEKTVREGGFYTNDFLMLVEENIQTEMRKIGSQTPKAVREQARKKVEQRIVKNRAFGTATGMLIGALCGPVTAVASALAFVCGVGALIRHKITRNNTEEQELLLREERGSTANTTSQGEPEASKADAAAVVTGAGITGTGVAAGIAVGLEAAGAAVGCGIGLGVVAGVSSVAGAIQGGIIGNDKTRAVKSQNCGQVIKAVVEQTLRNNLDKVKKTYKYPLKNINEDN